MSNIVGQTKALRELSYYIRRFQAGENFNILLTGPSGYGKTTIAYWFAYEALGHSWDNFLLSGPPKFLYSPSRRLILMDEVQELETPENLYSHMDAGRQTFILTTNETGRVKVPLLNRCIPIELDNYTVPEMMQIVKGYIPEQYMLNESCIEKVARLAGGTPRVAKVLTQRIVNVVKELGIPDDVDALIQLLEEVLNINGDGLSPSERRYVDCLRANGGKASLQLLISATGLARETLLRDIEPKLVIMKVIEITPRGRRLVGVEEENDGCSVLNSGR